MLPMIVVLISLKAFAGDCRFEQEHASERSIVPAGKRATALVVMPNQSVFGSAFCIHKDGYFLTNHHVIEGSSECDIILYPGEPGQTRLTARVVRSDKDRDLALIKADDAPNLTELKIDEHAALIETDQIMAFGYPFGAALALRNNEFPTVTVLVGRVTAIRKKDGRSEAIQVDAQLNPGNSGGPILNSNGSVVGVVISGIRGTGLNYAIPAHILRTFLEGADLHLNAPEQVAENEEVKFTVTIDSPLRKLKQPTIRMEVRSSFYDHRSISMTSVDGKTFEATLVPVPAPKDLPFIGIEAEFTNGLLKCRLPNISIRTDHSEVHSADLRSIEHGTDCFVIKKVDDSLQTSGSLHGLPTSVQLGTSEVEIDLLSAKRLSFSNGTLPSLTVTLQLSDGGMPVNSKAVIIDIKDRADAAEVRKDHESDSSQSAMILPHEFTRLGETRALPEYLTTADALHRTSNGGVRFSSINSRNNEPAGVIQTRSRDFLDRNFVFDVLLTFEKEDRIAYIGLGAGRADRSYNGLTDSVYLRFHAPTLGDGQVDIQNWRFGYTNVGGKVPNPGINRVRIVKEGNAVSFHVDPENDGPTDDDLELTIPDIREFSPFLNSKNTNLFLAGSGTFLATRLVIE